MVCGKDVTYPEKPVIAKCSYCGVQSDTDAICVDGHYVCDACHCEQAVPIIQHICLTSTETDMIALMQTIRKHPAMAVHGPEHHAMVPGIITATYRNIGGHIEDSVIKMSIERGATVAGGSCSNMGACGAALGVGIAFSNIIAANPLNPKDRQTLMNATQQVLAELATYEAARCCQRDSCAALKKAAELSSTVLPLTLKADMSLVCEQMDQNKECMGQRCLLWPT